MMRIVDGEKHSFWADGLPAGLSVVRQFDKLVLAVWMLCLVAYAVGFYFLMDYYDLYTLLAYVSVPSAIVGLVYIIDRRNIIALVVLAVLCAVTYLASNQLLYMLIIVYLFFGSLGVSCIVDAIQRVIFYQIVSHIRYVNVKEKLTLVDRLIAFLFNVPPDLDTRNITINPKKLGSKFAWREMGSTIFLSMIVGMFFWIYLSMNPMGSAEITASVPMFLFGVILYIPILVMPISVFKSLDVKIGTNYRDFKLYNGACATIQRMAIPIAGAFMYILTKMKDTDPVQVLLFIGYSAVFILFIVILISLVYFYAMEATTSSDISKKWNLFIPVPLMMSLHEDKENDVPVCPGTPVRDESDMSEIDLSIRKRE